jgi:hypothetical protein
MLGMSMVNLDSYIDSRRIKFIYRIINEQIENWNAIDLFWFPPFVHIVKIVSMLGLIFDRTRDTCLNLRMKHLSICK